MFNLKRVVTQTAAGASLFGSLFGAAIGLILTLSACQNHSDNGESEPAVELPAAPTASSAPTDSGTVRPETPNPAPPSPQVCFRKLDGHDFEMLPLNAENEKCFVVGSTYELFALDSENKIAPFGPQKFEVIAQDPDRGALVSW